MRLANKKYSQIFFKVKCLSKSKQIPYVEYPYYFKF